MDVETASQSAPPVVLETNIDRILTRFCAEGFVPTDEKLSHSEAKSTVVSGRTRIPTQVSLPSESMTGGNRYTPLPPVGVPRYCKVMCHVK
jgi:hypothetical protein